MLVAGLVLVCAVLAIFLFGVLCIVRKDLTLRRPAAAASRPAHKRNEYDATGLRLGSGGKSDSLRKTEGKRVLSPLLAVAHLETGKFT